MIDKNTSKEELDKLTRLILSGFVWILRAAGLLIFGLIGLTLWWAFK